LAAPFCEKKKQKNRTLKSEPKQILHANNLVHVKERGKEEREGPVLLV